MTGCATWRTIGGLAILAMVGACTGIRALPAPPAGLHESVSLPGYDAVRVWGDAPSPDEELEIGRFVRQVRARAAAEGNWPNDRQMHSLVLSGGGSDGPFGAGLLVGWTETGTRPEFGVVTGISAGALIAPFAFLGPDYDYALRAFTAEGSTDAFVSFQIFSALMEGVGLLDNSKLSQKLRGLITPQVVAALAREYDKGRRLLIGTTNLDAQRPVYWRIAAIAAQGQARPAEAADLITKIIIASASIPGAFPPQLFAVTAGNDLYTEMHVDGGVTNQLFFLPIGRRMTSQLPPDIRSYASRGTIHVIRNTRLRPVYSPVEPGLVQITARSISTMIKFGGRGDIFRLASAAHDAGYDIRVASVPDSFDMAEEELFDPHYMQALFNLGYDMADDPGTWSRPGESFRPPPPEPRVAEMRKP